MSTLAKKFPIEVHRLIAVNMTSETVPHGVVHLHRIVIHLN